MNKQITAMLLACITIFIGNANAANIDFDSDTSSHFGDGNPYQEDGFQISNSLNNTDGLLFWGNTNSGWSSFNADPNGNTLSHNHGSTTMTLTKVGGGLFDFNSIDLGDVYNAASGGNVLFDFVFGNSTTLQSTVSLDNLVGLQTFLFNHLGLSQVSWTPLTTNGQWLQLDNIVIDSSVAPVPVPAAVWLFGSALTGLVGIGKRKRAKTAA